MLQVTSIFTHWLTHFLMSDLVSLLSHAEMSSVLHIEFVVLQSLLLTIVTGVCHRGNDTAIDIYIDN